MKKLTIPELSLVVLIGASGSGKSTFARKHFRPTEVLSSDYCRGLVADDENDQSASKPAFEVLHFIASKRLAAGRLTVVDATNVQEESRKPLVRLARDHDVLPVAIVLDLGPRLCAERNRSRPDRDFGEHVVRQHCQQLRRALRGLEREGFRYVHVLDSIEAVESAVIERQPLWVNKLHECGPFDIIGDVHGCYDELTDLLTALGYSPDAQNVWRHPATRKAIFVGDLVDRGPRTPDVLRLVMAMVEAGTALCVAGNHDVKLVKALSGRNVEVKHGLEQSLAQLASEPEEFRQKATTFLDNLIGHFVLDAGRLVVTHAGMKEQYHGRASRRVREFGLYGETTGETDEFGLPVRHNWAAEYKGRAAVVYGHTPVPQADWLNNTINIDTGCVFGGKLTALRYPERELVSIPARQQYAIPARPIDHGRLPAAAEGLTEQQRVDEVLDIADVIGKRVISARLVTNVVVREENTAAALEVMSRFAANPKWLIYLPPTMSPPQTSRREGYLEHPDEAFEHFRESGVRRLICEEKHMGSRAVAVVCRDEDAARRHFGVTGEGIGIVHTRTGRRFFDDMVVEQALLDRLRERAGACGLWNELQTQWLCLDCELMPWSAKAQELLQRQYAAVGSAGRAALREAVPVLEAAASRNADITPLLERFRARQHQLSHYTQAYQSYCWPVSSLADLRLAPFHLLATEKAVHVDKDHTWHMETLHRLCGDDPILMATKFIEVDLADAESTAAAIAWWQQMTEAGGEGMVVKPRDFIARGPRGLVQPAVKCRGREYLRIIYGPEYDSPENLQRLRSRHVGAKRSLAIREFALGVEALERFVRKEPLRRVHECVFGVLALETEPVDPRL